jgi:hypothetical protein
MFGSDVVVAGGAVLKVAGRAKEIRLSDGSGYGKKQKAISR